MKHNKSLGQNFLTDTAVLAKIIETANLAGDETVVEVGAGDGFLTRGLENQVKSEKLKVKNEGIILALEFDYRLVERLRQKFKNSKIVKIIHQDALRFDWESLPKWYRVVANIPYQITSPLLNLWTFTLKNQPSSITIMVQKEVAERLTAEPGSAKRGLTTILVELYGKAEYIATVPAKAFFPVPKVDSAIINVNNWKIENSKIDCKLSRWRSIRGSTIVESGKIENWKLDYNQKQTIIRIAKAGFSSKRRTLSNSLSGSLNLPKSRVDDILKKADIDSTRRAETLTIKEWLLLTETINSNFID